jgi:hypothetical protein
MQVRAQSNGLVQRNLCKRRGPIDSRMSLNRLTKLPPRSDTATDLINTQERCQLPASNLDLASAVYEAHAEERLSSRTAAYKQSVALSTKSYAS